MKPYIECLQQPLKSLFPKHGRLHYSLKLTLDPGDFVPDPSKLVAQGSDLGFCGLVE